MASDLAAARDRARQLRDEISFHNHRYHVLDRPLISDGQFDALVDELRQIERDFPELVTPDSPTQRAGHQPAEGFRKVIIPRLSEPDKATSRDELIAWHTRIATARANVFADLRSRAKARWPHCRSPLRRRAVRDGGNSGRRTNRRRHHSEPPHAAHAATEGSC